MCPSMRVTRLSGERFSTAASLVGVRIDELEIPAHQVFMVIQLGALQVDRTLGIHNDLHAVEFINLVVLAYFLVEVDGVTQAGAAAALHAEAKTAFFDALDVDQALNFFQSCVRERNDRGLGFGIRGIHSACAPFRCYFVSAFF
ncbi:hypothetical protein NITLEN_20595 [Nitrospira lenta]|uniref:Uncharacterized protein n=1 Tax=Nitrospira lenta TaxID=1436998 RepID=A0A330L7J2_9BACT|nr:hypothetical protein NITLEN_20595 [Nitrospira lenta]